MFQNRNICFLKETVKMIVNNVFDELFSTWSYIAVIRALENYKIGISGREVARLANLTPKNCLITLSALENMGIVIRVRGSREHLFSLNRKHYLVQNVLLPILNIEKNYLNQILKEISIELKKHTIGVYLFGSVARKSEKIESDFDLCIIYNNKLNKTKLENIVSKLSETLKTKFGISLAPFFITKNDFIKKINKPPVNNIIIENVFVCGLKIKDIINGKKNN